jgi:hypothetical protein
MKIPQKYQIFDEFVEFSDKDQERLKVHLVGWNHLNEILLLGSVNEADLKRLVILELSGSRRMDIVNRLLGRLAKVQRRRLRERIQKLVL